MVLVSFNVFQEWHIGKLVGQHSSNCSRIVFEFQITCCLMSSSAIEAKHEKSSNSGIEILINRVQCEMA